MIIACFSTLDVHSKWKLKRNRSHYHAHDACSETGVENYLVVDADTGLMHTCYPMVHSMCIQCVQGGSHCEDLSNTV